MRMLAVNSKNPRAFSFIFNLWGAGFAFLIFLSQPKQALILPSVLIISLILCAILLYSYFERLQFYARREIEASTITILFRLAPAITFAASILILGEPFGLKKFLGFALVLFAAILVSYKKDAKIKFEKAFFITLACAIFLGLAWTIDRKIMSSGFSPQFYSLLIWILPLIFIYLPYIPKKDLRLEVSSGSWKIPLLAFFNVFGFFFQLKALSLADASRVIPLVSVSTILTVLGGIIILKEKSNLKNKIIAGIIVFIGILLLG
jgi:drug/metabolite transporter (DMT)-like permease